MQTHPFRHTGHAPLLARFTFEDKAAKGLRKRKAGQKPEPPVHFSALELVRDHRYLLLTGPSGSGKTTFFGHLCSRLAAPDFGGVRLLVRNELGHVREERWDAEAVTSYYFAIQRPGDLKALVDNTFRGLLGQASDEGPPTRKSVLIVLDGIEMAGSAGPGLLDEIVALFRRSETARLLLLGETSTCSHWVLPSDVARHEVLPLLELQRKQAALELLGPGTTDSRVGMGAAAANPALFALALRAGHAGDTAEELVDAWLSVAYVQQPAAEALVREAYTRICDGDSPQKPARASFNATSSNHALSSSCVIIQQLLAARHLADLPPDAAIALFRRQQQASSPVIRSCLTRLGLRCSDKRDVIVKGLLDGTPSEAQRGALLVADLVPNDKGFHDSIRSLTLDIVTHGSLSASEREKAGRILSRLGDPRGLTDLAQVPAGSFVMGSESHPNSQPVEPISLEGFSIGLYPVVNRDYLAFVRETGREWLSPDGADPERLNAPATDLTWHGARAYCSWLTERWRSSGRIGPREQVRLPTEPEWERAARGDQDVAGSDGLVYPWGVTWEKDAANGEEMGFNTTCAVGLFPRGRSPYGCYDMAGHIWEWCTTVWGEDMATPSFKYPWREDGREALDAAVAMRRVLRGGCFSSPKTKANCTYRGSLEPSGFWRGNGFRIVVAPVP